MSAKPDLYVGVHKGQRAKFFEIASKAGELNHYDKKALDDLRGEIIAFKDHMVEHAKLEENNIHPLLRGRTPEGTKDLEEDHRVMHATLDSIVASLDQVSALPELGREQALEFYRGWNRFLSFYFNHIDKEEEKVNPLLWKLCSNDELLGAFRVIISSQSQEELRYALTAMMPAMNMDERSEMLLGGSRILPAEAYQGLLRLAEGVLRPKDWDDLKGRISPH